MLNHCEEGLWTCDNCSFQTYNLITLKNHLDITNHKAKSLNLSVRGTKCNFCEYRFATDKEMWAHRKSEHGTFKPCRNLPGCSFGVDCYYSHIPMEADFRCFECGEEFNSNRDMMVHRHNKHKNTKPCLKFSNGTCRRSEQECWWSHNTNGAMLTSNVTSKPKSVENNFSQLMQEPMVKSNVTSKPKLAENNVSQQMQGFWKYPTNLAPPAPKPNTETLMLNMMDLMQQLMMNMKQA